MKWAGGEAVTAPGGAVVVVGEGMAGVDALPGSDAGPGGGFVGSTSGGRGAWVKATVPSSKPRGIELAVWTGASLLSVGSSRARLEDWARLPVGSG